jgi:hypothetical protein
VAQWSIASIATIIRAHTLTVVFAAALGFPEVAAAALHDGNGATIAFNDDWKDNQQAEIQESGLAPADDREAVVIANFRPGPYTAIVRGRDSTAGLALVEAYKLN